MKEKTYEIISTKKILLKLNPNFKINNQNHEKVEKNWKEEILKTNGQVFNDSLLNLIDYEKNKEQIEINSNFVDFKILLSQQKYNMQLNIKPIGISGIILNESKGKKSILFSTRTKNNTNYQNFVELVPSGHINKTFLNKNGIIDYKENLIQEFSEETGFTRKDIINLECMCLVKDRIHNIFDICYIVNVNLAEKQILKNIEKKEYKDPQLININKIQEFVCSNKNKIVPTSLAILECFCKLKELK